MSIEVCPEGSRHVIPDQINFEGKGFLEIAMKTHQTTVSIVRFLKRFFRDRFYLPLNQPSKDRFYIDSGRYATQFTAMIKGENSDLDGTFPLPKIIEHFMIRDVPVEVDVGESVVVFQTRVIESKREIDGKKLRLILFSFADHQVKTQDTILPWDPMHIDELSGSVLDILKAYRTHVHIDSMMCFSLGTLVYDGLKHISLEESELIPATLIFNRGLTSIRKVAKRLFSFPVNFLLYYCVSYLGLDADPEKEILRFFRKMKFHDASMDHRKVVVIEARDDRYFSGKGKLSTDFYSNLSETGIPTFHGTFSMPMIVETAHHAIRLDWIINNQEAGTDTTRFLPFPKNKTLAEGLATNILKDTQAADDIHTCLIIGGNKDNLDSITYLQAAPLLAAYLQT